MLIVQKWVKCFSFLLVDKLLWLLTTSSGLPTSIVSESLGSYEKLAQAVVGGITGYQVAGVIYDQSQATSAGS